MKKILVILLVLAIIPAAIFAKGFSVGVGVTAATGATISSVMETQQVDPQVFAYGGYANVKLFLFSVNATMFPIFSEGQQYIPFTGDLSANLAVDISILRVQAGLSVNYFGSTDFDEWKFQFENENIMDAPLSLRAEVDVILGDLNVGVWGILPTTLTLGTFDKIFDLDVKERWQDASLGLSLGFCF